MELAPWETISETAQYMDGDEFAEAAGMVFDTIEGRDEQAPPSPSSAYGALREVVLNTPERLSDEQVSRFVMDEDAYHQIRVDPIAVFADRLTDDQLAVLADRHSISAIRHAADRLAPEQLEALARRSPDEALVHAGEHLPVSFIEEVAHRGLPRSAKAAASRLSDETFEKMKEKDGSELLHVAPDRFTDGELLEMFYDDSGTHWDLRNTVGRRLAGLVPANDLAAVLVERSDTDRAARTLAEAADLLPEDVIVKLADVAADSDAYSGFPQNHSRVLLRMHSEAGPDAAAAIGRALHRRRMATSS